MTPTEVARFMGQYAKHYSAGAFAVPTRKDLEANPGSIHEWGEEGIDYTVAVEQVMTRESSRRDFTGESYQLHGNLATHVAHTPGATIPDLGHFNYIMAYLEDHELIAGLQVQGFNLYKVRVSASAELIGCFWKMKECFYPDHDLATTVPVQAELPKDVRAEMAEEVAGLTGFRDDWPQYSDGTWGALCLRGFYPEDPGSDMKPSEMPRKWKLENPADLARTCEWTALTPDCPAIVSWVQSVAWWGKLERVRLLQMSGNNGKGGALGRHTDIGDKDGGTRDGMITRFHTPIVTDPRIQLHSWDLDGVKNSTHLEQWRTWYLDARKPHAVTNPTGVDRVHLVVDVVSSPEVRAQIAAGYLL